MTGYYSSFEETLPEQSQLAFNVTMKSYVGFGQAWDYSTGDTGVEVCSENAALVASQSSDAFNISTNQIYCLPNQLIGTMYLKKATQLFSCAPRISTLNKQLATRSILTRSSTWNIQGWYNITTSGITSCYVIPIVFTDQYEISASGFVPQVSNIPFFSVQVDESGSTTAIGTGYWPWNSPDCAQSNVTLSADSTTTISLIFSSSNCDYVAKAQLNLIDDRSDNCSDE